MQNLQTSFGKAYLICFLIILAAGVMFWRIQHSPSPAPNNTPHGPISPAPAQGYPKSNSPETAAVQAAARPSELPPHTTESRGANGPETSTLPNFDSRPGMRPGTAPTPSPTQLKAFARLTASTPGLTVEFDPVTGSPKWLASPLSLLTKGAGWGGDEPIIRFVTANADLFGHDAGRLSQTRRVTDYTTAASGNRKVVWHQQFQGIDIFEAVLQANLTKSADLINIGSQFIADPQSAVVAAAAEPAISAAAAVVAAGANVGEEFRAQSVRPQGPASPEPHRHQSFKAGLMTDAEAKLVWLPMDAASLRLTWDVTIANPAKGHMYRVLVDAQTQAVLVRHSLTAFAAESSALRVFTTESPTPFSPGHRSPSSLQPPPTQRTVVGTAGISPAGSPEGWLPAGASTLSGNNADAYTDTNADNIADTPRAQASGSGAFDFPLDLSQPPSAGKDASATQLFYWANFAHDRLYDLGFTEAAGNFQASNFDRGGLANDPVLAEAQDGSGLNNANFSTPVDGGRGRMQMYLWTGPTPHRDGSFDGEVVIHEYCHGLSNRLVGGPTVTISSLVAQGLGEGWSDFYGLALTAEASDDVHANWARAGYSRYLSGGAFTENFYFGARRYSYSTDMEKNPHTFRDIDPSQVDWHPHVPRNPTFSATQDPTQVHYQGTVWCAMLWELRANLILKHGFTLGNERTLFLVTEGMKLCPANPNFVQARDGILQSALVHCPADLGEMWSAFAKRGLGHDATAPASNTTAGLTESFAVPDPLELDSRSGWTIRGSTGGAFARAVETVTLSNDGATPLRWTVATHATWLQASPAAGDLAPGASAQVSLTKTSTPLPVGFHGTNVVFTNTATGFNQPIGVRVEVTPPPALSFPLDHDPGWTRSGQWAFGAPSGAGGGGANGLPDPASGATGAHVFGANLTGNISTTPAGPFHLTLGPLDLSAVKNTRLRFQRWLNVPAVSATKASVEVSTDGATWHAIFINQGNPVTDSSWHAVEYDISRLADERQHVYVRWSYQVLAATGAWSGWNIDDVQILGEPATGLALQVPHSLIESDGPALCAVLLSTATTGPTIVTLGSSSPQCIELPASIIIPAGQTRHEFTVVPVNDSLLDGAQHTVIQASAPDARPCTATLIVTDDETTRITITAPAIVQEGTSGLTGSLALADAPARDVEIPLATGGPALVLPTSVIVPAGSQGPITFPIHAPDNSTADGDRVVEISAAVPGWIGGAASVTIADDETPLLILTGPSTLREGDGAAAFALAVNTPLAHDLTVSLTSSIASELAIPATVTIPAGVGAATFTVTVADDTLPDGAKTLTLRATAPGLPSTSHAITVRDNEVTHYTFDPVAPNQKRSKPFAVAITARSADGAAVTNHSGGITLTAKATSGAIKFTPASLGNFSSGIAAGFVTVTTTPVNMVLTARDTLGRAGASNPFTVRPVQLDRFEWTTLPATSAQDTWFNATATAKDDLNVKFTGYTGPTVVEAYAPVPAATVGAPSTPTTTAKIYNTAAHDSRSQIIYTAAELGGAPQWLGALQLHLAVAGTVPMAKFTIRLKETDRHNFIGASWEDTGWTTVCTVASAAVTSSYFAFTQPFYFSGRRNLMLDISFNNTRSGIAGTVRQTPGGIARLLSASSNSTHGDPLKWTPTLGPLPAISGDLPVITFFQALSLGPIPASPVNFAAGVWKGQAFAPTVPHQALWLLATAPTGAFGFSNKVTITPPAPQPSTDLIFADSFDSGALGPAWSTAGGSPGARARVTTANAPKKGYFHLTLDCSGASAGQPVRTSATLTLDLAGRQNVMLDWHAKSLGDEPHAPALSGPLGTFDSAIGHDGISISVDGLTWCEVAPLRGLPGTYGATASRVYLDPIMQRLGWAYGPRLHIRFSQFDDESMPADGICIDEVSIRANPRTAIALEMPPTILEGTAAVPVTIRLPFTATRATPVTLATSAGALLTLAPLTIPAGQSSALTTIAAPQNHYCDLGCAIVVTATATGFTKGIAHIRVIDDEQPRITITLPATVVEGGGPIAGHISLAPMPAVPAQVYLSAEGAPGIGLTDCVTIGFGAASAPFTLTPQEDGLPAGARTALISASGQGMFSASTAITILENEAALLPLPLPTSLASPTAPLPQPGDHDGSGMCDLLEHALGITSAHSAPHTLAPAIRTAAAPPSDQGGSSSQLLFEYRRLRRPHGIQYIVQFSPDLTAWQTFGDDSDIPPATIEETVQPNPDGHTETVLITLPPGTRFARLRITTPR